MDPPSVGPCGVPGVEDWRVCRGQRRSPRLGDALAKCLPMLSLYRSCKCAAACFAAKAKPPAA